MTHSWIVNLKEGQKLVGSILVDTEIGEDPYLKADFTDYQREMIKTNKYSLELRLLKKESKGK